MLLCEQRRGHQNRDLLAAVYGSEGRPERHLRLAESHVAADDAIHRLIGFEIGEDVVDRVRLVLGQLEREAALECTVVGFRPAEAVARPRRAPRIDVEQFRRDVPDPLRCFAPGPGPLIAAEPVQRRVFGRGAGVA